jgi:hypothetical protein
VRDLDESRLEALRSDAQIRQVEIRHPSLEEIFVGYLRGAESEVRS